MECATVAIQAERGERTIRTPGDWLGLHVRGQGVRPMHQGVDAVEAMIPRGGQHAVQRGEVLRTLLGPEPAEIFVRSFIIRRSRSA